jgi:sigma-B regulation protein RsbU (phosphoserine phosphatase)
VTENDADLYTSDSDDFLGALLDDDPIELYENAPCGYLSTLPDGTIVKANQTFLSWTGFDREELVGRRRLQELFPVGDRIFYETHWAPLLRMQGTVREIAVELVGRAGDRLPVLANAVLKRDPDGHPQVVRTVLFDARERRTYEQELVAARDRAEAAEARARELATTLQEMFLPPTALEIPGFDVAGVYRPAGDGAEIGGDFYDVFPTGPTSHAILLGDVSGKGAAAAVVTALVRHVVRAELLRGAGPAASLTVAHHAVRHAHPEHFCTAVVACIDGETSDDDGGGWCVASAGHHLPLITDGEGIEPVGITGTILGLLDTIDVEDVTFRLAAGQRMVLYTDGITEARAPDGRFFGEEGLEAILRGRTSGSAADLAGELAEAAVAFQDGVTRDDIAVVAVHRP